MLKVTYVDGASSNRTTTSTILENENKIEKTKIEPTISQNIPNPFSNVTRIELEIDGSKPMRVIIYHSTGKFIREYNQFQHGKNEIEWDGTDSNGMKVSPGLYFYSLKESTKSITKRMYLKK